MTAKSACILSDASKISSRTSCKSGGGLGSSDTSFPNAEIATCFVSE